MSVRCQRVFRDGKRCNTMYARDQYCPSNFNKHPQCANCESDYCRYCVADLQITETCPSCRNWIRFECSIPRCQRKRKSQSRKCALCKANICNQPGCSQLSPMGQHICRCCLPDEPASASPLTLHVSISVPWGTVCYSCNNKHTEELTRCADPQCIQFFCRNPICSPGGYVCGKCTLDKSIQLPAQISSTLFRAQPNPDPNCIKLSEDYLLAKFIKEASTTPAWRKSQAIKRVSILRSGKSRGNTIRWQKKTSLN